MTKPKLLLATGIGWSATSPLYKTLKQNLIDQVTGTVKWRETMEFAKNHGVKKITEL